MAPPLEPFDLSLRKIVIIHRRTGIRSGMPSGKWLEVTQNRRILRKIFSGYSVLLTVGLSYIRLHEVGVALLVVLSRPHEAIQPGLLLAGTRHHMVYRRIGRTWYDDAVLTVYALNG